MEHVAGQRWNIILNVFFVFACLGRMDAQDCWRKAFGSTLAVYHSCSVCARGEGAGSMRAQGLNWGAALRLEHRAAELRIDSERAPVWVDNLRFESARIAR